MSGFGADLKHDKAGSANVIGLLNKPFTSDLLLKTVDRYMPKESGEPEQRATEPPSTAPSAESYPIPPEPASEHRYPAQPSPEPANSDVSKSAWPPAAPEPLTTDHFAPPKKSEDIAPPPETVEAVGIADTADATTDSWWSAAVSEPIPQQSAWTEPEPFVPIESSIESTVSAAPADEQSVQPTATHPLFFAGATNFFPLNRALQTIGKEKLTGTLRLFWNHAPVEVFVRNGEVVLVTTRDPKLYCPEAPVTLVNVASEKTEEARAQQHETGCPIFLTLARQKLIVREPAIQLVQHYGQKLFVQLWTAPQVRFEFEQTPTLPDYTHDVPTEPDIDHWMLSTLRSVQLQELEATGDFDAGSIPAYTRSGVDRVQALRLTVAEAQFASQFNGSRSVAQIARNLRLDLKFARLTLFRFLALEIIDLWPPTPVTKPEKRGFLKSIGLGE
jgi:hypothetical protein